MVLESASRSIGRGNDPQFVRPSLLAIRKAQKIGGKDVAKRVFSFIGSIRFKISPNGGGAYYLNL